MFTEHTSLLTKRMSESDKTRHELVPTTRTTADAPCSASETGSTEDEDVACCDSVDAMSTTDILFITLVTNTVFTVSQGVAAILSNSVSLQGDSADMAVDTVTYGLNYWVESNKKTETKDTKQKMACIESFVVAVSAFALLIFTCLLFVEAGERLRDGKDEYEVEAIVVFIFSSMNLAMNVVQATMFVQAFLRKEERSETANVNLLSAAAHVFADTLRTISEMVSSSLAVWAGLDPVLTDAWASLIVNTLVLASAAGLLYSLLQRWRAYCREREGKEVSGEEQGKYVVVADVEALRQREIGAVDAPPCERMWEGAEVSDAIL